VRGALLAVAGPVANDRCVLTNSAWTIDASELCATFSFAKVHILNDFEATALSLPLLTAADLYPMGGGKAVVGTPMAVLGPGSGLGVACFVPGSQSSIVIASEGGHATMPATSDREDAIIDYLRRQFSHVSAERVVSGSGLENLYSAVIAIDGIEAPKRDAADITNAALDGTCPVARAALDLFCAMLGTIAVALMFGARGGFPRPRPCPHTLGRGSRFGRTARGLASPPRKVPHETQLKPFFASDETIFRLRL